METVLSKLLSILPAPVAAALMLGGFVFYALGCVRLGYGAAVKPLVLDLIERAEQEIQGQSAGRREKRGSQKCSARPSLPANTANLSRGPSPMRLSVRSSSFSSTGQRRF